MSGPDRALDVRPVQPKDRFTTIMDAYESLGTGDAVEITMDHEPACMYYTLEATRGADAFDFDYLERGPVTWRVRVTKKLDVEAVEPDFGD